MARQSSFSGLAGMTPYFVDVDEATTYQEMDGFGAALTDSSAAVIAGSLSAGARDELMARLFDRERGIGLSLLQQVGCRGAQHGFVVAALEAFDEAGAIGGGAAGHQDGVAQVQQGGGFRILGGEPFDGQAGGKLRVLQQAAQQRARQRQLLPLRLGRGGPRHRLEVAQALHLGLGEAAGFGQPFDQLQA